MIILTVKTNDLKGAKTEGMDYAKAWFRLQNEDTNQTLDYSYVDKVKADEEFEEPEEGEDAGDDDAGDDDEEPKAKVEHTILCGRIYNINTNPSNTDSKTSLHEDAGS